jgi:hypothetical protein
MGRKPLKILLQAEDQEGSSQLYKWLADDRDLVRSCKISLVQRPPSKGSMGGSALPIIQLLLGSGFSAANLALAIHTWRKSGTKPQVLRIEVQEADRVLREMSVEELKAAIEEVLSSGSPNEEDE